MRCRTALLLCSIGLSGLLLLFVNIVMAQSNGQNIRGTIIDDASRVALEGVTVQVAGVNNLQTSTNANGNFAIFNVPLGRYTLLVTRVGYDDQAIPEVLLTAGKEVFLNINLQESIGVMDELIVRGRGKRAMNNEMVAVSGTSFNPSDTRRYAGAVGDPSRMISNVAGVASASDGRNDIVVRGNSPSGLLWQIEGMNVPNPNHYGSLSSTGGPVSILNSNNLDKSDFITGAFPAQYGNALASVFDLRLRNGNAYKTEFVGEINFTGFEAGVEGPFSKKSNASYIVNYRYSTVGVLNSLGFNVGTGAAVPQYQDVNFKVFIPLSAKTNLSVWGLGGPSRINFWGNDEDTTKRENLYGNENQNLITKYFTGITGINMETNFSTKTHGRLNVGFSSTEENINRDSISTESRQAFRELENRFSTKRYELSYHLSHKFNARSNIVAGASVLWFQSTLRSKKILSDNSELVRLDQQNTTSLLQSYVQLKHRLTQQLSFNAGLHHQTLTLNNTSVIEPRFSIKYDISRSHSVGAGYGLHNQMQQLTTYFNQSHTETGIMQTNKNLGFTQSHHIVLNHSYKINSALLLKTELYYQAIGNVPVTRYPSGYSALNQGADFGFSLKDSLVSSGTGRNYGIELTLEKTFSNNYYFLATGSLYNSSYKGSDGVVRNTAFNSRYIYNVLAGKDFIIQQGKTTISVNFKVTGIGGRYTSPVDVEASSITNETIYDEMQHPYSMRQTPFFRADLKLGYRRNYQRVTMETGIDLRNFTNRKNIFTQNYNRRTNTIINQYQQGFLPVPYFRITF